MNTIVPFRQVSKTKTNGKEEEEAAERQTAMPYN